jgi:hypothetical protein
MFSFGLILCLNSVFEFAFRFKYEFWGRQSLQRGLQSSLFLNLKLRKFAGRIEPNTINATTE